VLIPDSLAKEPLTLETYKGMLAGKISRLIEEAGSSARRLLQVAAVEGLDAVAAEDLGAVSQAMMELSDALADKALNPAMAVAWPVKPEQLNRSRAAVEAVRATDLREFLAGLYRPGD
jgi:hypothetical protein